MGPALFPETLVSAFGRIPSLHKGSASHLKLGVGASPRTFLFQSPGVSLERRSWLLVSKPSRHLTITMCVCVCLCVYKPVPMCKGAHV